MTVRPEPGSRHPGFPHSATQSTPVIPADRLARRHALERAYPIAKQLAEILELEAIEPLATSVKHVRQAIGSELAEHVALDPHHLDPAEVQYLASRTIRELEEDAEATDGG